MERAAIRDGVNRDLNAAGLDPMNPEEEDAMNRIADELVKKGMVPSLTHDELLRTQALAAACRYYVETIVDNGELYLEMVSDNRVLKPATYLGVVQVALAFEKFIRGQVKETAEAVTAGPDHQTYPEKQDNAGEAPRPAADGG